MPTAAQTHQRGAGVDSRQLSLETGSAAAAASSSPASLVELFLGGRFRLADHSHFVTGRNELPDVAVGAHVSGNGRREKVAGAVPVLKGLK